MESRVKGEYRTVEELQTALAAAPASIAQHAGTIAAQGIDGELALMLKSDDEMVRLLPECSSVGERLNVLRALHEAAKKVPPRLSVQDRTKLGEDLCYHIYSGRNARYNMLVIMECVMLLAGLLSTVSASALLSPQCDPAALTEVCTPLQMADAVAWVVCLALQLLAVMAAVCNVASMSVLDDDELMRWGLLHYRKIQTAVQLLAQSFMMAPIAFVLRLWILTTPTVAGVAIGVFVLMLAGFFFLWNQV